MFIIIVGGIWALTRLNVQFFPNFHVNYITVSVTWPGSNAEDITKSITTPLEDKLRDVDHLKKMYAVARTGNTTMTLEFEQTADMAEALDQVKQEVDLVRNLPATSEKPVIKRETFFENIATLVITTSGSLQELRPLIYKMERQLYARGIAKVSITGLPEQEIAIQIPSARLHALNLTLSQIAEKIRNQSRDLPAGTVGRSSASKELRSLEQRRSIQEFGNLQLVHNKQDIIRLGDIAKITRRPKDQQILVSSNGKTAVEMTLFRTETGNSLTAAKILQKWLVDIKPELPASVSIQPTHQIWQLLSERINLLLKNGAIGFILVLLILFLFLNARVAFWVAVGIPTSFLGAMIVMLMLGKSINMISLFAMIMTLGIIVDDSIVVGEETLTHLQQGKSVKDAVVSGTNKMLSPVFAASLTTICAFIPLLLISDIMGQILADIPTVVICVISASLIECFLILPGHLKHSFTRALKKQQQIKKPPLDKQLVHFRENIFRPFVKKAINNRWTVISITFAIMLIIAGVLMSGRKNFTFFPEPEGTQINVSAEFVAGTPATKIEHFLTELTKSLNKTAKQLSPNKKLIVSAVEIQKRAGLKEYLYGDELASMNVELTSPEDRKINNDQFINAWRKNIKLPTGLEAFLIRSPKAGPPGDDIEIELSNDKFSTLKDASLELQSQLKNYPGVTNIQDNLPYGKEQLIYKLTAQGQALGLTTTSIGQQLRAAFNGEIAQIFHEPNDEIEVRVMLPDNERYNFHTLNRLPILTPQGKIVPLDNVIDLTYRKGFDILRHKNNVPTVTVSADVNNKATNANKIIKQLQSTYFPQLRKKYNLNINVTGRFEDQQMTLKDMGYGLILALVLIYLILAWVFSSYGWPLLIMAAIPIGLTGAIIGHMILGIDLTILSLFGLFGLAGIVVNDSIILTNRYKELRDDGMEINTALIEATCQRLRPVILTSVTTIAGLLPLLFETSRQAQFLKPMAVSISFGLGFATILILVVVPSMLAIYENIAANRILPTGE